MKEKPEKEKKLEKVVLFDPINRKESGEMEIISREKIGEGTFSIVYKVVLKTKNYGKFYKDGTPKEHQTIWMAMKEYKEESKKLLNRKKDKEIIEIFNELKEEDVPTLNTFRLNRHKKHQFYMSLEDLDEDTEIISSNTKGKSFQSKKSIVKVSNEKEFFDQCWKIIENMHNTKREFYMKDALFIYNNAKGKCDIKVYDFDNINKVYYNKLPLNEADPVLKVVKFVIANFFSNNNIVNESEESLNKKDLKIRFDNFLKRKINDL